MNVVIVFGFRGLNCLAITLRLEGNLGKHADPDQRLAKQGLSSARPLNKHE